MMDDSLSIIEEEMEQLSVTTGETISSDLSWLDLGDNNNKSLLCSD